MDNFKIIYILLSTLEKAMDYPAFDVAQISAERLGISEERWARYIEMLSDEGYIKGAKIQKFLSGDTGVNIDSIRITLKGLEYLRDNTIMKQIQRAMKGIKESVPIPNI